MRPHNRAGSQVDEKQPLITQYLKKKTERINFYEQEKKVENMGKIQKFYPDIHEPDKLRDEIDDLYEEIGKTNAKITALKNKEKKLREKIVIRDKKLSAFRTKKIIEGIVKDIDEIKGEIEEMDGFYDAGEVENMEVFEEEYACRKGRLETLEMFKAENEKQFEKELDEIVELEDALDEESIADAGEYSIFNSKQIKEN